MGSSNSKVTAQDKQVDPISPLASSHFPSFAQARGRAILDLKLQRDKLHQYQRRITVLTDKETAIAKQMLAKGDKQRALLALRRKKYQESLLAKTDSQLAQLEQLTSNVEFALIQKDVVFGLQQGTRVLKEIHAEMGGIEGVEKLMGENAEAIAYQKEIEELLHGRISVQEEEEVEEELAAIAARIAEENAATEPQPRREPELPVVPDAEPKAAEQPEPQHADAQSSSVGEPERRQMLAA